MANRKLPLPLFSSKPSGLGSIPQLHFIAAVRPLTHGYALVCESQPLMTSRSHGLPARCPICGAPIYLKENASVNHQG